MHTIHKLDIIPAPESHPLPWTQKQPKLVAIWEIDRQDPNHRKLICRWVLN
jgi:hypothetical protein